MAGGAGGDSGEPEFQIAPMIDVLLVLLIFFMRRRSKEKPAVAFQRVPADADEFVRRVF